jgi:hypothetical protein
MPTTILKISIGCNKPDISSKTGVTKVGSCKLADEYFVDAAAQTLGRNRRFGTQARITVYHDSNLLPVLLRKDRDESSSLTLTSMQNDNGLVIPPGSIVYYNEKVTNPPVIQKGVSLCAQPFDNEQALSFLRLSAFAYDDPIDRALFATEGFGGDMLRIDGEKAQKILEYDLDDFRTAARIIVDLCYNSANL